jgi:glutathione S-transferase
VKLHGWAGVDIDDLPNLRRWMDTMAARPAVERGLAVPGETSEEDRQKWLENFRAGKG